MITEYNYTCIPVLLYLHASISRRSWELVIQISWICCICIQYNVVVQCTYLWTFDKNAQTEFFGSCSTNKKKSPKIRMSCWIYMTVILNHTTGLLTCVCHSKNRRHRAGVSCYQYYLSYKNIKTVQWFSYSKDS